MGLTPYLMTPRKPGRRFLFLHRHHIGIPTEHLPKLLPQPLFRQKKRRLLSLKLLGLTPRTEAHLRRSQPLALSRLIQGHLEHTGIEACPKHRMDHGVRDPSCDHSKRALGPLHQHKIKGNRHVPVFTLDCSGPHPQRVNAAQYLLVCVWSCLGDMIGVGVWN